MAGMLPGVESARRRRFHQGGGGSMNSLTRRSTFCLYATGVDPHLSSSNYLSRQRSSLSKGFRGGELGHVAREAKERLDERLRTQRTTEIKRHNSTGDVGNGEQPGTSSATAGSVQREVYSSKRGSRKFSWSRLGWRAAEQRECAVCLENFSSGDVLLHLPCAHRFHWNCVMRWIESSSHCPCCRTPVPC